MSVGLGGLAESASDKQITIENARIVEQVPDITAAFGVIALRGAHVEVRDVRAKIMATPSVLPEIDISGAAIYAPNLATRGEQIQLTKPPPPPPKPIVLTPHHYVFLRVADCESGDFKVPGSANWSINTGNGFFGGLQFTRSSWIAAGGLEYAAYPHQASMYEQIIVAERLLQMQGPGAWPVCGPRAGLTR